MTAHCPTCDRQVRVTEPYAFRGMDRERATLGCGHIVLRVDAGIAMFTAADRDGDKLAVEEYGPGQYEFTVSGEDGHRTVILTDDDIARLVEVLADIAPIHRG